MSRKWAILGAAVVALLYVGWQFAGPYDWDCHRCGMTRTRFFGTRCNATDTSRWLRKYGMDTCEHYWVLNSSAMGLADCGAMWQIPVCRLGSWGRAAVDSLPEPEWRLEAVRAMADERNLLKWGALEVMQLESPSVARSPEEWESWRRRFGPAFTPEYDASAAREKAKVLLAEMRAEYKDRLNSDSCRAIMGLAGE